jgi:hypothetical protein
MGWQTVARDLRIAGAISGVNRDIGSVGKPSRNAPLARRRNRVCCMINVVNDVIGASFLDEGCAV